MPVKVISQGSPLPKKEVLQSVLNDMIQDFENNIGVARTNIGTPVIKKYGWYFTKKEILDLFDANTSVDGQEPVLLEINFAVNVPGTKDVCENDLSNMLTLVLKATNIEKKAVDEDNQYVLIPGFDNASLPNKSGLSIFGVGCCPSYRP